MKTLKGTDWRQLMERIGTALFFSKWTERIALAAMFYAILVLAIQIGVGFHSGAAHQALTSQIVEGQ